MYEFLKCPRCTTRYVTGGRRICDRCVFEARAKQAKAVRVELERSRRKYAANPLAPKPKPIRKPVAPVYFELEPEDPTNWWEVSFLSQESIRVTVKFYDSKFAAKTYNELVERRSIGAAIYEVRGKTRTELDKFDGSARLW